MIYYVCVYTMYQRLQSVILLLTAIYFSQSNANCDCGKFTPSALHMSQDQTLLGNNAKIYMGSNSPNNLRYPWYVHVLQCGPNEPMDECIMSGGTLISIRHVLTCAHCVQWVLHKP